MHSIFSKIVCLLLLIVASVAQLFLDSKAGTSTYPTTANTMSSLAVGSDSIDGERQSESVALDPISPTGSDLDAPLTQQDSQCPAGEMYQHSRKLRGRGKSCENPAANPPTGQEKPPQASNWWQQFWTPDPSPETGYLKTEPYKSEEYCPYPDNRIPVCSLQSVFGGTVAPPFERLVLPDSRIFTPMNPCGKMSAESFWCCHHTETAAQRYTSLSLDEWRIHPLIGFNCIGPWGFGNK